MNRRKTKLSNQRALVQLRRIAFGAEVGSNERLVAVFEGLRGIADTFSRADDNAQRAVIQSAALSVLEQAGILVKWEDRWKLEDKP